jgi:serine/threonine protein kinase KIN1/2
VPYREAVGALNWAALATRPDIAFAVATVARFAANPGPAHWEAVADIRRVLDRMQVQYRETKTGFDCIHLPSIDISSLQDPHGALATSHGNTASRVPEALAILEARRGGLFVRLRSSRFGVGRKDKDRVETSVSGSTHKEKEKEREGRPSGGAGPATLTTGQSSGLSPFSTCHRTQRPPRQTTTQLRCTQTILRRADRIPPRAQSFPVGEVDREVLESIGQNTLSV